MRVAYFTEEDVQLLRTAAMRLRRSDAASAASLGTRLSGLLTRILETLPESTTPPVRVVDATGADVDVTATVIPSITINHSWEL